MKKIFCILLSLMMILPFSACKRESKHPILSETRRPDHTTITTSEETIAETTVPEETIAQTTVPEETAKETTRENTIVTESSKETIMETTPEITAETQLPEETITATQSVGIIPSKSFSFEDLNRTAFQFSSGAGAWRTILNIQRDGSFFGEYSDSNMGETGDGYPNGSVYCSNFTGRFSQPVMVDEYTYSIRLEQINYRRQPGTEEIRDGVFYHYTEAYGLYGTKDFLIYLPGTPLDSLPENFLYWTMLFSEEKTALPFYGLYAPETENSFSSYDTISWIRTQVSIKEWADSNFESILQEADTQTDINEIANNRYRLWDDFLNELWRILNQTLDPETMRKLTSEELDWIAQKEQAVADAGAEYKGGSLYPAVTAAVATTMTKERVYELLKYLP